MQTAILELVTYMSLHMPGLQRCGLHGLQMWEGSDAKGFIYVMCFEDEYGNVRTRE